MIRALSLALLALLAPLPALAQTPAPPAAPDRPATATPPSIEVGSTVQLEYTLHDDTGALIGTNKGQEPITYTQGQQQIMAALEIQLTGLRAGEEKHVVLRPEEAYGPIDPAARAEVPKASLPPDALVVGTRLMARNAAGEERPVMVQEIKDNTVVLDLNHPLAGRTLVFDVKVLSIAPPKAASPQTKEPAPTSQNPVVKPDSPTKGASPAPQESQPTK